ncbi:MAG TPA: Holliday junction branch migration protein RuvA [Chitinophagaceae bacterium]|nr:Holliday junction branch migration protein RuvA [Chitinophagaceae bacterium]
MFAFLKGEFVHKQPAMVAIDVNGVGYEVQISLNTYSRIQGLERGVLFTHLQIQEDKHTLYGFFEPAEKEMFLLLLSVGGVGAATARMMLSSMKPEEIVRAISQGNARVLESIKGIGKKSAERIILELRDKVGKIGSGPNISPLTDNSLEHDALNALISLGIARNTGEQAVKKVMTAQPDLDQVEEIIKKALKLL